ncbi:acetylornithine aminotransferase [Spiribacter salinus M19-40]|uniref:Acetylornithine aminotransferase n=1 Tax=Spiribacter salinus M19-40 TaxID=1260251 RepID=R4VLS9_9GAMM|nr:acetylornithine transaminase [Spiribacter salinus]AGM41412.1 acetylornithine aminotransferase [Spiribacter salinus M19-40]
MSAALMPTYARLPVAFQRGQGAWLEDTTGRQYLDALTGIAVCGLGHGHPAVAAALADQAATLVHTSNLYDIPHQNALGERLCALSGLDQVFFANSGAEAAEAAIKLARLYGHRRGIEQPEIIVAENAFHGRTLGALAATGNAKAQTGFGPLPAGFVRVPYNDPAAVEAAGTEQTAAVFVEPIQGEGGIVVPDDDYLAALRRICDDRGWLLMLDEVQSGVARTGQWFAHAHAGIRPDVVTLAKALANGVPIGACIAGGAATGVLGPGSHGTTFGGNPLATRAALAVLDVIEADGLAARAATLGTRIREGFRDRLAGEPGVREIRGRGLMIGIELAHPCPQLVAQALAAGLLINVTAGQVVRLLPPLIMSDAEADQLVSTLAPMILAVARETDSPAVAGA